MTDVSRFTKYTSGEPVITVNVAAGLAFGLLVVLTEEYLSEPYWLSWRLPR